MSSVLWRLGLLRSLVSHLRLAVRLLREPRVPLVKKALPVAAALYLVFPLDVLPDVLPLLGRVDDLAIALVALQLFVWWCPEGAVAFHRDAIARGRRYTRMPPAPGGDVIDAEWRREDGQGH